MKKRLPVCEIGQMLLSRNNSTGGKSMPGLDEKRGTQRQPILKAGTISFDGSGIDCVVRNMSREGANLEVESQIGIPNSFDLVIDSEHSNHQCHVAQGLNPIDERKRDGGIPTFGEMADEVRGTLSAGFRNEKHKAQWKSTLETHAAALRAKPVDTIATDDVLAVLKPIWTKKAETASRVRGRIEKVLDAAKAKGFREGENPARWRGHLDHLLPRPSKLARGHHAAMPYDDVAAFIAKLRKREALAALALELCILTAARSSEILGVRWPEVDLDKGIWTLPKHRMKA